jgi:hypothetical protein
MTTQGIRKSLYLSPERDSDIIQFIQPLISHYDFSSVVRDLIRDGMKYRSHSYGMSEEKKVLQSMHSSIESIPLGKKKVSDEDLSARLDNF